MAKFHSIYPHARLIECPSKWTHYKELNNSPLVLLESEFKYPGELFFDFSGLRSTIITNLETRQKTINDNIFIKITTHRGEHFYLFEVWYD